MLGGQYNSCIASHLLNSESSNMSQSDLRLKQIRLLYLVSSIKAAIKFFWEHEWVDVPGGL